MTPPHLHRSSGTLARSALLALVLAGCAGTAASQDRTPDPAPTRTAILAGTDARPSALASVTAGSTAPVTIRRTRGTLDAQAQATRLAAEGFSTIIAVGAEARGAVSQAASAEVGDAETSWQTR